VAQKKRAGTLAAFIALLYYEFLWNIRKKKIIAIFIIIFAIATVQLAFTPIADALANPPQTLQANSTFVFGGIEALTGNRPSLLRVPLEYSKEKNHRDIHNHIRHRDRSARLHPDSRCTCKPAPNTSSELYIRLRRNRGIDRNLPLPRWCRHDDEHRLGRV